MRKRPLNKKEIAKKEQDIITIEPNSNCLTVHETKLKVSSKWVIFCSHGLLTSILDEIYLFQHLESMPRLYVHIFLLFSSDGMLTVG